MKIALINDTHMGARGESFLFNDFFFKFWEGTFFPYLEKHNIKHIFHLGDFVDRRKFINYQILSSWRTKFLDRIRNSEIKLDVLVGNHDCPLKNTNFPNAVEEICFGYENVRWYADPTEIIIGNLPVALVPWVNASNEQQTLELLQKTKAEIVFGHLEIAGFEMERGNPCYVGITPREILDKFDMVISGHFHHKSTDGLIYYLGNQYEMTWADYNDERGFHIFDTETRELEFVKNPNRMFYKIAYEDSKETFESIKKLDLSFVQGTYVKIIVVNKTNPYWFDFFLEKLYKAGVHDVSIIEDFTGLGVDSTEINEEGSSEDDTNTILDKSVDSIKDSMSLDPERLKRELKQIHTEALALETV
jgi:DNA repair exonuclease SbcCD nuclease subunit